LIKFTHIAAKVIGADFVLNPSRKHVSTLSLIAIAQPHPLSPTFLSFFLRQWSRLFEGLSHGLIERTGAAIEGVVTKPEVNYSCFHPDALVFDDVEALNFFGLAGFLVFLRHG
jgi:hypothetical protein